MLRPVHDAPPGREDECCSDEEERGGISFSSPGARIEMIRHEALEEASARISDLAKSFGDKYFLDKRRHDKAKSAIFTR